MLILPSRPKRCSCYSCNIWGYWTDLDYRLFAHNIATILALNIFESKLPILLSVSQRQPAEWLFCQFFPKLVAMVTSLKVLEKEVQIDHLRTNTYYFVKRLRKSVQWILS